MNNSSTQVCCVALVWGSHQSVSFITSDKTEKKEKNLCQTSICCFPALQRHQSPFSFFLFVFIGYIFLSCGGRCGGGSSSNGGAGVFSEKLLSIQSHHKISFEPSSISVVQLKMSLFKKKKETDSNKGT